MGVKPGRRVSAEEVAVQSARPSVGRETDWHRLSVAPARSAARPAGPRRWSSLAA